MRQARGGTLEARADGRAGQPVRLDPTLVKMARFVGFETNEQLGEVFDRLVRAPLEAEYRAVFDRNAAHARGLAGPAPASEAHVAPPGPTVEDEDEDEDRDEDRDEAEVMAEAARKGGAHAVLIKGPKPKVLSKGERAAEAKRLRAQDLSFDEIGERLGVSGQTIRRDLGGR